jgi:hypothetical protein
MMFDLAIAYRIYPGITKTPAFHAEDKFRLAESCLRSFSRACGALRVKVWALLDGCPPEYETLFRETLQGVDLEILNLNKIGNLATFSLQIDLLTRQTDAEYVYFAEDDYFYFPGALEKMVAFMRDNPDADFVTPYDHPDSYITYAKHERHLLKLYGDRYWRTAGSTCLTFLTSHKTLLATSRIFRTFARDNRDCSIWMVLAQKFGLANLRVHFHDRFRMESWVYAWWWGLRQILFSRKYRLWGPMPTLATHMDSTGLAPLIDWQSVFHEWQCREQEQQSRSGQW